MRPVLLGVAALAIFVLTARKRMEPPGFESSSLADLAPDFRGRLQQLLQDMQSQGYDVQVLRTYRSPERQQYYKDLGYSQVTRSYHTVTRDGKPYAYAADVTMRGLGWQTRADVERLGPFYVKLRDTARKYALRTGGEYSVREGSAWAQWGLGWDPGHIEPAEFSIARAHRGDRWTPA